MVVNLCILCCDVIIDCYGLLMESQSGEYGFILAIMLLYLMFIISCEYGLYINR